MEKTTIRRLKKKKRVVFMTKICKIFDEWSMYTLTSFPLARMQPFLGKFTLLPNEKTVSCDSLELLLQLCLTRPRTR